LIDLFIILIIVTIMLLEPRVSIQTHGQHFAVKEANVEVKEGKEIVVQ